MSAFEVQAFVKSKISGLGHPLFFCSSCPVFSFAEVVRKFFWEGRIRWNAVLVPVAQRVDNAIHWINLYPLHNGFIRWIVLFYVWTTEAWWVAGQKKNCVPLLLSVFDWILLIWFWFRRISSPCQKCLWSLKLMTPQAVQGAWIRASSYGWFRVEWLLNELTKSMFPPS